MAITFPRSLPNLDDIVQINTKHKTVVGVFEGLFSGIQKVQKHPFQRWEVEYTIIPLNRSDMDEWWSWVISMNGREKTFYGVLQAPNEIKGTAKNSSNPQLNGVHAARVGSLSIDTAPAGAATYLRRGDYIQIGTGSESRLHMVLEDVSTSGSGEATFDIWPDLQTGYADNSTVTVSDPKGVFRMMNNEHEIIQDASNTRKGLRFSAVAVI